MSNIEWTDATWNPVIGCAKVADGCKNCYAEKMSKRLAAMGQAGYAEILDEQGRFNGKAINRPDTLDKPLRWRKPRTVFVNSMSDLFHKDVPFEFIAAVYGVMAACPQHTFQVLTKRPERMLEFMQWMDAGDNAHSPQTQRMFDSYADLWVDLPGINTLDDEGDQCWGAVNKDWPLNNVWHGTSIANQKDADRNIPILLQVPSAVRFISAEPLIGPVQLDDIVTHDRGAEEHWSALHCDVGPDDDRFAGATIGWVIVGGESGPGARPCDIAWIRSIIQQCKAASVPCFVKQVGSKPQGFGQWEHEDNEGYGVDPELSRLIDRKGGSPEEWPKDLRVREFPEARHA